MLSFWCASKPPPSFHLWNLLRSVLPQWVPSHSHPPSWSAFRGLIWGTSNTCKYPDWTPCKSSFLPTTQGAIMPPPSNWHMNKKDTCFSSTLITIISQKIIEKLINFLTGRTSTVQIRRYISSTTTLLVHSTPLHFHSSESWLCSNGQLKPHHYSTFDNQQWWGRKKWWVSIQRQNNP